VLWSPFNVKTDGGIADKNGNYSKVHVVVFQPHFQRHIHSHVLEIKGRSKYDIYTLQQRVSTPAVQKREREREKKRKKRYNKGI
jgi:hypothetical protein